ncbi:MULTISPECIES: ABC transporter permease subunit [unclassified Pseudodesulfovibrio]|uniref:molybdate ABC transporter permease subunit n=1 Tax=unclassified Pseudodesulfovibrio TaxID=2661612 RepID=UPI000FEC00A2|nr:MULTISPECIES: ABC transporter permease subunit [unclassified Pseudodesulfovibrio]MCJ2164776.1 ABC transporter permease subunit [Pseudodesulfovibrio sp. S3-i]RWU04040.1 ABC transporter permease subunit [Pseudodesulfovibrio sp. S3]
MDFIGILTQPQTTGPLWLTLKVLVAAGSLHLVSGILLGYYLTSGKGMMRSVVDFLVTLPLVFPPIATGFILLMLLGRAGMAGRMLPVDIVFSFPGIVLASFVAGLPLMVKPVEAALRGDVQRLGEVSQVLGKTDWQTFWLVLLPNVRRNVASGWFLALGRSLGEVGITLMLGGNIIGKTNTLSLEIYNAVFSGEFDRALVMSAVIGLFSLSIFIALKRLSAV